MKITIETIPHDKQRYPTVGDWFYDDHPVSGKVLRIFVSSMSDWRHEAAVALHELAEALMCEHAGVTQKQVDEFDINFEANRKPGSQDEPGDSPEAPYAKQHGVASGIERIFGAELGIDWNKYADEVNAFP